MNQTNATARVLKQALKYVRKGWVKNSSAETKRGAPVDPTSRSAARWCITGAVHRACSTSRNGSVSWWLYDQACYEIKKAAKIPADMGVPQWNDKPSRTKAQVIKAFQLAIKRNAQ